MKILLNLIILCSIYKFRFGEPAYIKTDEFEKAIQTFEDTIQKQEILDALESLKSVLEPLLERGTTEEEITRAVEDEANKNNNNNNTENRESRRSANELLGNARASMVSMMEEATRQVYEKYEIFKEQTLGILETIKTKFSELSQRVTGGSGESNSTSMNETLDTGTMGVKPAELLPQPVAEQGEPLVMKENDEESEPKK